MSNVVRKVLALWHGGRAGRAGLAVDEAADTAYLVRLRRQVERDRASIAGHLEEELAALQGRADAIAGDVLRARCAALVARARASQQARLAEYELVCAAFGRAWRRHHRDRHFAHLGWRSPRLPADDTGRSS